jgi:hypothetical protein
MNGTGTRSGDPADAGCTIPRRPPESRRNEGFAILAVGVMLAFAACSNDGAPSTPLVCGDGRRIDRYENGLEKVGDEGQYRVRIVEATPNPPDRGDNVWTFEVTDSADRPLAGALVRLSPWMPDHGHGSVPPTFDATPSGEGGRYTSPEVRLFMPGFWQIKVSITALGGGITDEVTFGFCIEG